jgi:hypothetical protein
VFINVFVIISVPSISKPKESDHDRATFRGAPARRICGAFWDMTAHRIHGAFRDMSHFQIVEMPYAQRRHFGAMIAFNYCGPTMREALEVTWLPVEGGRYRHASATLSFSAQRGGFPSKSPTKCIRTCPLSERV